MPPQPNATLGNALAGNAQIKIKPSGDDVLAATDLCRTITNPRLTAEMSPADVEDTVANLVAAQAAIPLAKNERPPVGASPSPESTPIAQAASQSLTPIAPIPVLAVKTPLVKVFLTGRLGGDDEVARQTGAFVINMKNLVESQMKQVFGSTPTPAIAAEFSAWSQGVVTPQVPMTLTRTLLESLLKQKFPTFGQPDYWIALVDEIAARQLEKGLRVIVTGAGTTANFKGLIKSGFVHYHVMLSNVTAQNRTASPDALSTALDNDVIKKISFQRDGTRLHVVWNDNQPSPSGRFYSLPDFLAEFQGPSIAEGEVEIQ
jgi:hypothetical protein